MKKGFLVSALVIAIMSIASVNADAQCARGGGYRHSRGYYVPRPVVVVNSGYGYGNGYGNGYGYRNDYYGRDNCRPRYYREGGRREGGYRDNRDYNGRGNNGYNNNGYNNNGYNQGGNGGHGRRR